MRCTSCGRRRADLEFTEVSELLGSGIHAYLDDVQQDVRRASELVATQFFRPAEEFAVFHSLQTPS